MAATYGFLPPLPSGPATLPAVGTDLDEQVRQQLATDTDATVGLVSGLGYGVDSIYPNPGGHPTTNRDECAVPFLIVLSGGKRAHDRAARESRVVIEVHDDPSEGMTRIRGLLQRLKSVLVQQQWTPAPDLQNRFVGGIAFDEESPPLPSETYGTQLVQLVLVARGTDLTSNRGYQG